jgi:saccharopine dehydrogenase (NAD+, L-lysine-forming)
MKAIVIGCGEMGETAIADLYEYGEFEEILVATRSPDRAQRLIDSLEGGPTRLRAAKADAGDTDMIARLMEGFDVAVNCAGPNYKYEVPVALAAIKAGVDLVDINDDYETTFEMFELNEKAKEAGIKIVLGLGASPGVNNVLVRAAANQLDEVEEIRTAWVMSGSDPGGLALAYHLLYSLSGPALTYENDEWVEVQSFVDGKERREFPDPVGPVDVYHIGHPEPITLKRTFPAARYIDDKASFVPAEVNDLIVSLGKLVREADGPLTVNGQLIDPMDFAAAYFQRRCRQMSSVDRKAALKVSVTGKKRGEQRTVNFTSSGLLSMGTGIPASIGAIMIVRGDVSGTGVMPPEECIDANDFIYEMIDRREVARLNGWID